MAIAKNSVAPKRLGPFCFNPKVARRNARLYRLKRQGITGHETKAQMQAEYQRSVNRAVQTAQAAIRTVLPLFNNKNRAVGS